MDELNFLELTNDEVKLMNKERAEQLKKQTNGMLYEIPTLCPIINDLRYNHYYWLINPFLINNDGCKFELHTYEDKKHIHLAFIGVLDDRRQQGYGTKMMEVLTGIADKYGYTIDLNIDPKFGVGKRVLKKFYKKFGFGKHTSKHMDNDAMLREPKKGEHNE